MATATNFRRVLYANSEPRPKDSTKKRNGSPPKRASSQKNTMKKPKKELSPEEYSTLAYQSISLLLEAARTLDEAEKRARIVPKPKPKGHPSKPPPARRVVKKKKKEPKQLTPTTVTQVVSTAAAAVIPTAPTETAASRSPGRPKIVEATSTTSSSTMSALSILTEAVSPSHQIHRPLPTYRSGLEQNYSLPPSETPLPAPKAIYGIPSPVASSPREVPAPKPIYGIPSPVSSLSSLASFNPLSIMVPEVTSSSVPLLSPTMPTLRPSTIPALPESLQPLHPRLLSSMPIPPEFADIAVPVAPRSVSAIPKVAPKPMKLPRLPTKKWTAQVTVEQQKAANFGHLDECRTRIPDAVRRYWERLDKKKKESGESDHIGVQSNFYW